MASMSKVSAKTRWQANGKRGKESKTDTGAPPADLLPPSTHMLQQHTLLMPSSASRNFWRQPWKMYEPRTWRRYRWRRIRRRMVVGYAANTCVHPIQLLAALSRRHHMMAYTDPRLVAVTTSCRHHVRAEQ